MVLQARQTLTQDVPELNRLLEDQLRIKLDVGVLLDATLLCLTAVDKEHGHAVGFLCLRDVPCTRVGSEAPPDASLSWLESLPTTKHNQCSTAYVSVLCTLPEHEVEGSACLFRAAQIVAGHLRRYLLATSTDITFVEPGLAALFTRVTSSKEANTVLYEAPSYTVLPPLSVRQARVEDHDDLLPVLERASTRYPALSQLPLSSRPEEAFALARVVANQDERNCVFVAHDLEAPVEVVQQESSLGGGPPAPPGGGGMRLAGFMVATSEVDTTPLLEAFDLHPYDNLLPQEEYERQTNEARDSVRRRKMAVLMDKLGHRLKKDTAQPPSKQSSHKGPRPSGGSDIQASADQQRPGSAQQQQQQKRRSSHAGGEEATGRVNADVQATEESREDGTMAEQHQEEEDEEERPLTEADLEVAAEPTEEEVHAEMAYRLSLYADESGIEPTAFAITMACLDEPYEGQAWNFLQEAFDAFPDKQYCVLTLPHDSPEPPLVSCFTRLDPMPGNSFPEVLYLINRYALMDGFDVRPAEQDDAEGVSMLVAGMPNSSNIQELFRNAQERGTAVVAAVQGEIVGLVTISTSVDIRLLRSNFSLSHLIDLNAHSPSEHAEIDMVCVNPIFKHRARDLLSGVQRILQKTVLYYALPPGQAIPDCLDVMQQVPPRHQDPPPGLEAEFALYMFSRRTAFLPKQGVNAQIVVVGASEAGLSAIERLLLHPYLHLNYITLLAPGGISVNSAASQYTKSIIARLGLQARIAVLDAEMVGLDRAEHAIALSDGRQLNYDFLLVTCGVQEQTANTLAQRDPDVAGSICGAPELTSDFMYGDSLTMERIIIYGAALDAYQSLEVLHNRGGMEKLACFCCPPNENDQMAQVLRQAAEKLGCPLPEPTPACLTSLSFTDENEQKPTASFEEGSGLDSMPVDLVIGCQPKQVSASIFASLNDSGIVYDGRVVVDASMCTSDPNIYAAGTCAKLSRRYGDNVQLQHYSSRTVGRALGDSVLVRCAALSQHEGDTAQPNVLPLFDGFPARVVACQVPRSLFFMFSGCPKAHQSPSLEAPVGGRVLATTSDRGYMQLALDSAGMLYSAVLLGQTPLGVHKMATLTGLNASFFNNLVAKFDAGQVPCLFTYLTMEPWASLMHHDEFPQLRQQVMIGGLEQLAAGVPATETMAAAGRAAYKFISHHRQDFPKLIARSFKTVTSEQAAEEFARSLG